MINKDYWDRFYQLDIAPTQESDFARFVSKFIHESGLKEAHLIDVACGNGRDAIYFQKIGIKSTAIDLSASLDAKEFEFIQGDILNFDYENYDLIYLRFVVHALKESDLDRLLHQISLTSRSHYVFIETRSSRGVTDKMKSETYFKSVIGDEHFRMLYSEEYLTAKLRKSYEIILMQEDQGFAIFNDSDPFCIRYILKSKIK